MTYDEFLKLRVDDPIQVEIFKFENYYPRKYIEILPIKAISQSGVAIEYEGELKLFHFRQISRI